MILRDPPPLSRQVPGLEDLWARLTGRAPWRPGLGIADRMVLDTIGLGLEQAQQHLGSQRPDLAAFESWILATAGPPDRERLGRYISRSEGRPPPPAARARLDAIEAMAPVLSETDLQAWERDGVVVVPDAISHGEAAEAAAALWQTVGGRPDDPSSWYRPNDHGIMVQRFQHPAMEAARRSPRIHKAFAQLWGSADLWLTIDRLSFNPPETPTHRFRGPHLHWDCSLATPIPFATQGILYLEDTAADQGALTLVPGFHHRLGAWLDALGPGVSPRDIDLSAEATPIAGRAGDLIIWRQDLPHGASANLADRPRLAQYINMYHPDLTEHPDWV
ncbi:MAG: phytanoyl-CoA dioxygenase family protein [Caulobacter sp.]|nr:phytanoyl-CoA dioxygenase family protein [Caulobacter sp.]